MRPTPFIIRPTLALFAALTFASSVQAGDLDVEFKANIRATTCDMSIGGATTTTTIPFGDVLLNDVISHRADTSFDETTMERFTLDVVNCPESLKSLKTAISGVHANDNTILISSVTGDSDLGGLGVQFSRSTNMSSHFLIYGATNPSGNDGTDTQVIYWSQDEIDAKKIDMVAHLVTMRADATNSNIGAFQATATFNFTYE